MKTKTRDAIGLAFEDFRVANGFTEEDLADIAGVDIEYIHRFSHGDLDIDTAKYILESTNLITIDEFLEVLE